MQVETEVQRKEQKAHTSPLKTRRGEKGMVKLLGAAGILMSLALPIGVVPRLLQEKELDSTEHKLEAKKPVVSVSAVEAAPASRTINLPGTVEAILETPVYARTNGYVKARLADIGDRVSAGALLATIETPEVENSLEEADAQILVTKANEAQSRANQERARADLNRVIAELSQAKASLIEREADEKLAASTFARWKQLGDDGAVSMQEVDERETRLKTSVAARQAAKDKVEAENSNVVAARARLQAELANVDVSKAGVQAAQARARRTGTEKSFQNVTAPFAGVITERNVESGMLITSGSEDSKTPLYRIARIDTVKVFVDVPQYASPAVAAGQSVGVSFKEIPGQIFTGKVARTSVALDATARTLRTEIHVPNGKLALAPGMYADVQFEIPRTAPTFIVPANALVLRAEGPQVIVLNNENKVQFKAVTLGHDLGKQVEITAGLTSGEKIVVNPADTLKDGSAVDIDK